MNLQDKTEIKNLAHNLARSFRPHTTVVSWLIYLFVISIHNKLNVLSTIFGLIIFITIYGIVTIQNDLSDLKTDTLNHRQDIPYALGLLTEDQLIKAMLVSSLVATLSATLLSQLTVLFVGLYIILGYLYSGPLNVKSRGVVAALLLGFCYGAMPWLIGASVIGQTSQINLLITAFVSFVFSSGVIVLKDFKDVEGDAATHKRTLLVRKGSAYTRRYYLITTSLSYAILIGYVSIITSNVLLICIGILLGCINYKLLSTKLIFSVPIIRLIRGTWTRMLFFTYISGVYYVSVM